MQPLSPQKPARRRISWILWSLALLSPSFGLAAPPISEVKVTLFGQPCLLRGPLPEATLQKIHSVSPAAHEPAESAAANRKLADKLRSVTDLPSSLDGYREKLLRRLTAQVAYFEAVEAARKLKSSAPLLDLAKKQLKDHSRKLFEAQAKKPLSKDNLEQLSQIYTDAIEPDPQDEFHRATRQMGLQYACSFEEDSGDETSEESSSSDAPASASE